MFFPSGQTVFRDRRPQVTSPTNPERTVEGSWDSDDVDILEIQEAFVASSSSVAPASETRSEILTAKSLYVSDPDVDVKPRDRIRVGGTADGGGDEYFVKVIPESDTNPFTGWQPVKEIPLERTDG
jgi:hypothetical protein